MHPDDRLTKLLDDVRHELERLNDHLEELNNGEVGRAEHR